MNRTVKMEMSYGREPRLFGYESARSCNSWPCTTEGFLLAFAFMWQDEDRLPIEASESIDVALDGLVNESPPAVVAGTAGGRWKP